MCFIQTDRQLISENQVGSFVRKVDPSIERPAERFFHNSGYVVILHCCRIAETRISSFQLDVVPMPHADTQGLGQPVGIYPSLHLLQNFIIFLFQLHFIFSPDTVIIARSKFQIQLFPGIQYIIIAQIRHFEIQASRIGKPQFSRFGFFCRDHNHTVCATRTVNSSCRSVFQQSDRLHLAIIQIHHAF